MIVKVWTYIVAEVASTDEAEQLCARIDSDAESVLAKGFPVGELIAVEVEHYQEATAEEIEEKGWSE